MRRTRLLVVLAAIGCATGKNASVPATGERDWGTTLAKAEIAVSERRYADADRLLAEFANQNPASDGAVESLYWRGLIELEPANHDGAPSTAAALFEAYNKAEGPLPHRIEADILRHLALHLESSAQPAVATAAPAATPSTSAPADIKAKDTEIQRLKDELAKANDELERIKRRLTAPTKP
ncbi:MAG TPA: hypothetical protein VGJ18_06180 [Gemmatimonadaceae bacterium]|jgi:hypothetical protein